MLPLGSYDMLLGIDWLSTYRTKIDCFEKDIECLDDDREKRIRQGKKKPSSVIMVTTMQEKHSCRKACVLFAVPTSYGLAYVMAPLQWQQLPITCPHTHLGKWWAHLRLC